MAKRYKRTGRKCKRCPTCGKTKRVAMKSKRTNRRMYGGRKYRRTRRKAGGRKYFMKGGGVGGVIVINDHDKDITFQAGFVDEKTINNFEPSAFNEDFFPPTKVGSGNRGGVDQGTQDPSKGKDRAIKIYLNDKAVVINRGKGGRHIVHIESNGDIKFGPIKADSQEINTSMSKEEILKHKAGDLDDVDTTAAAATAAAAPTAATTPTAAAAPTADAAPTSAAPTTADAAPTSAAPTTADAPTAADAHTAAAPRPGTGELKDTLAELETQKHGAL